jgi:formylglycine-generating enzyme required for sulfatase activity
LILAAPSVPAAADIDPLSGIDFVRVGAPGNAPWAGTTPPPIFGDVALGRGRVDYEYRIGRFEVTTREWCEFFNAAFDRSDGQIPWLIPPNFWGAVGTTATMPGGRRWQVPAGNERRPVGNISWRMAAIFANWLHNEKRTDRQAFMNGAYDVSTFGGTDNFTDQLTHNPGARYWIPTWDEWLKAAHFDPDKNGPGQGGWWTYSNGTDTELIPGPPGEGQANFGWRDGLDSQWRVPLGAYPESESPWGMLDAAGGTTEWTEGVLFGSQNTRFRVVEGSYWGSDPGFSIRDAVFAAGLPPFPGLNFLDFGFRIAAAVPAAPPALVLIVGGSLSVVRRRRSR